MGGGRAAPSKQKGKKETVSMAVPVYQIQNILTLYCRKLEQSWHNDKKQVPALGWKINVIAQSKKEMVINKITESILSKITMMGPRRYMEQHAQPEFAITPCRPLPRISPAARSHLFSFSILNENNVRIKKTIELGTGE